MNGPLFRSVTSILAKRTVFAKTMSSKKNIGVVMLNMGGPSSLEEVPTFLLNLFSDRDLLTLPFQKYSSKMITNLRKDKIIKQYKEIGGRSPILQLSTNQLSAILKLLNNNDLNEEYKGYIGFRYAKPYLKDELIKAFRECNHLVLFNQYMQYSCSTSGSSFIEAYKTLSEIMGSKNDVKISVIDRWPMYRPFIEAYASLVRQCIEDNNLNVDDNLKVIFSAHSVPITNILKGDNYASEVSCSVEMVMEELNNYENYKGKLKYMLCWQSKVGPKQWLEPHTDHTVVELGKRGVKNIIVVPISFTTDHIETLYELDIELNELARENGVKYYRAKALNNNEIFIKGMYALVKHFVEGKMFTNPKFFIQCKGCSKKSCRESKQFYKKLLY